MRNLNVIVYFSYFLSTKMSIQFRRSQLYYICHFCDPYNSWCNFPVLGFRFYYLHLCRNVLDVGQNHLCQDHCVESGVCVVKFYRLITAEHHQSCFKNFDSGWHYWLLTIFLWKRMPRLNYPKLFLFIIQTRWLSKLKRVAFLSHFSIVLTFLQKHQHHMI